MTRCRTCGQVLPQTKADDLLVLLHEGREVYRAQDGQWFVTRGGGPFSDDTVQRLVKAGTIQSVYSNCPKDAYHIGKTWDYDRTMALRKKVGKVPQVFVGDPPHPGE